MAMWLLGRTSQSCSSLRRRCLSTKRWHFPRAQPSIDQHRPSVKLFVKLGSSRTRMKRPRFYAISFSSVNFVQPHHPATRSERIHIETCSCASAHPIPPTIDDTTYAAAKVLPTSRLQQLHREARLRTLLALYVDLDRDERARKFQHRYQQSRYFSAGSGGESMSVEDGDTRKTESKAAESETGAALQPSRGAERTMQKTAPGHSKAAGGTGTPDWIENLSSEQISRTTIPDESETYRYIRRKQQANRENARARTAANVRRAMAGNVVICVAKLGAWISSGSSSILSEFVHSVVDCGNQGLLLLGLRDSRNVADKSHPYGYGKSVYFWALVSALGTFFLGSGLSMTHAIGELANPSLHQIHWEVWAVLGFSFAVDGYVLGKTVMDIKETQPKGTSFLSHVRNIRDPATLAVLLEDGAACLGVAMAIAGIAATSYTGLPIFDGIAGVGISALLGGMGVVLVKVNHRFLLGQAIDREITEDIEKILLSRRSIDNVYSVQSQWTGPESFSYKAEVDFDGTFLAAKLLPRYQKEFLEVRDTLDQELRVLLSWYAEDVMRTVEREVRHVEAEIRKKYPGAEYIELEPTSKDSYRFAVDDGWQAQLRRIELERLNRYLSSLYLEHPSSSSKASPQQKESTTNAGESQPDEKWSKKK